MDAFKAPNHCFLMAALQHHRVQHVHSPTGPLCSVGSRSSSDQEQGSTPTDGSLSQSDSNHKPRVIEVREIKHPLSLAVDPDSYQQTVEHPGLHVATPHGVLDAARCLQQRVRALCEARDTELGVAAQRELEWAAGRQGEVAAALQACDRSPNQEAMAPFRNGLLQELARVGAARQQAVRTWEAVRQRSQNGNSLVASMDAAAAQEAADKAMRAVAESATSLVSLLSATEAARPAGLEGGRAGVTARKRTAMVAAEVDESEEVEEIPNYNTKPFPSRAAMSLASAPGAGAVCSASSVAQGDGFVHSNQQARAEGLWSMIPFPFKESLNLGEVQDGSNRLIIGPRLLGFVISVVMFFFLVCAVLVCLAMTVVIVWLLTALAIVGTLFDL